MKITAVKTHKITSKDKDILEILAKYLTEVEEESVVAVSSKVIAICQGRIVKIEEIDKQSLIEEEAELFFPIKVEGHHYNMTIVNNLILGSAGIDESNGAGYFVLWPKNPQQIANQIRQFLKKKFSLKKVGVIITDNRSLPLRRGSIGAGIAHSGFLSLKNYIGTPDVFGKELKVTKVNVLDSLAIAAVLQMGEGNEQTPLAILEDLPRIDFVDHDPSEDELKEYYLQLDGDFWGPLIKGVKWQKGKGKFTNI
ncbi:coenzyme F420-0:L-glutamate ligase [Candidatus Daviesbacteria bacterium]|nr:coenzyme F420-0:L-glutamate ligase [Candidatus Daviesbacteria bacterium]